MVVCREINTKCDFIPREGKGGGRGGVVLGLGLFHLHFVACHVFFNHRRSHFVLALPNVWQVRKGCYNTWNHSKIPDFVAHNSSEGMLRASNVNALMVAMRGVNDIMDAVNQSLIALFKSP
jgi:hypothetical protein